MRTAIILILLVITIGQAYAYNTNLSFKTGPNGEELRGGHEKIADWSYRIAEKEGFAKYLNKSMLISGTADEDDVVKANALHHFYNPSTGEGLWDGKNGKFFGTAKFHAKGWYDAAVKWGSSYSLGHALHLVQDMAAPSHAHAAPHIGQSLFMKSGYEWWVTEHWNDTIDPLLEIFNGNGWLSSIRAGDIDGYIEGKRSIGVSSLKRSIGVSSL